jgi:DNA replication initiation complex subunit (GINS family)
VLGEVSEILGEAPGVLLPDEQELIRAAAKTIDEIRMVVMPNIIKYVSSKQPDLH